MTKMTKDEPTVCPSGNPTCGHDAVCPACKVCAACACYCPEGL